MGTEGRMGGSWEEGLHFGDGGGEADEEGAGDDGVADVEGVEVGDGGEEGGEVFEVEAVAGVDLEACGVSAAGGGGEAVELAGDGVGREVGVAAGVEFDHGDAEGDGGVDLRGVGLDEEGYADAGGGEAVDGGAEGVEESGGVEAAFGGDFLAALGDHADFVGTDAEGDFEDFGVVAHFEVERDGGEGGADVEEVGIPDVAAVFAEVDGDAVGAGRGGEEGGVEGAGVGGAAGVADGGYVVYVDA